MRRRHSAPMIDRHWGVPTALGSCIAFALPPMVAGWHKGARQHYEDPRIARDEAVRSATFGSATLIHATDAMDLASGPLVGFNAESVARAFGPMLNEVPVLLLAVGCAAPGNLPQKPSRPLAEGLVVA